MGIRRSLNLGPLRINASKSGLGYSIGGRGFRVGKDAKGRTYQSLSIPGTGISNRTYTKSVGSKPPQSYTSATQQKTKIGSPKGSGRLIGQVFVYGVAALLIYAGISYLLHLL